ncbi:MAG: hypothetical protein [Olavius algarvensis Delta 4 endosymbiont]|nr:MAG: hypothetical protein [Olavius algarvensis Delta 4 endosymbiont]
MYPKTDRFGLPETVDEAVDLLISDLLADHIEMLSSLSERQFDRLYSLVSPFVLAEFKLWSGNDKLLNACIAQLEDTDANCDPAGLILRKTKARLNDIIGVLIIT